MQGKAEHTLKDSTITQKAFTYEDEYWQTYKTMNMAEAQLDLRDEIQFY